MRITHFYGNNSQTAQAMHHELLHGVDDITCAYITPSNAKITSFAHIRADYNFNDTCVLGIPCKTVLVPKNMKKLNNIAYMRYILGTLVVGNASSHFYTTCALFVDVETNKRYIVKETHCNTYMCEL